MARKHLPIAIMAVLARSPARYSATVRAKYPSRCLNRFVDCGLLVHFAEWTPAMLARFANRHGEIDQEPCSTPNLRRLLLSLNNSLTPVAESDLRPFFKEGGRGPVKTLRDAAAPLALGNGCLERFRRDRSLDAGFGYG
jgi:hypothetical protein